MHYDYRIKMSVITDLHNAILAEITSKIAGIETSGFYPKLRTAIKTPAVFIDLASMEPGADPGTGELALIARFEARVVVGSSDNACLQVRELATEVARIINKNNFGLNVKAAALVSIAPDHFRPEIDAFEIWLVEWQNEIHIGQSVWDGVGIMPEQIFLGYVPFVGIGNEDKYIKVNEIP